VKERNSAKGARLRLFFMAINLYGRLCVLDITDVHWFDIAVRSYRHWHLGGYKLQIKVWWMLEHYHHCSPRSIAYV